MSKPELTKYEFSFPVAGQASPCYFDVRCLMCKGVPVTFDKAIINPSVEAHIDALLGYISDRSDAAKRNMYNHFRHYLIWAESHTQPPFTQETIDSFNKASDKIARKRALNRFHRIISLEPPSVLAPGSKQRKHGKQSYSKPKTPKQRTYPVEPPSYHPVEDRDYFVFTVDGELNKLIRDVKVEMSTDVLFDAYNGDTNNAGGKGNEITSLRQNDAVPDVYRERSAIKTMLEQGKLSLKFAGLNYCTNGYRCDQDGMVNAAFCVDCKSSIIDETIAKKWKRLHERCVGHLEFAYDCGDVSPVSYAHFTSQIRAAEHVMGQFGMQYEKFQELS